MTGKIEDILEQKHIEALQGDFSLEEMMEVLVDTLPKIYERSEPLVDAIQEIAAGAVSDGTPNRKALSKEDRERIIIALLASRGGGYTMAIHVYLAVVAMGIRPSEVANILLLSGIYTGVPTFATGLLELQKLLMILRDLVDQGAALNPKAINRNLRVAFHAD